MELSFNFSNLNEKSAFSAIYGQYEFCNDHCPELHNNASPDS